MRLGLLRYGAKRVLEDASENGELTHLAPHTTSLAARHYQAALLELSRRALEEVSLSLRNHTSATLCFAPQDMPAAIERLTEMRRQFAREFQPKTNAKEVYQLQISFFPLTKPLEAGGSL